MKSNPRLGNDPFQSGAANRPAPATKAPSPHEPLAAATPAPEPKFEATQERKAEFKMAKEASSSPFLGGVPTAPRTEEVGEGDWSEALERLRGRLKAAGVGGTALEVLDVGEELVRGAGLLESSLRSFVGPSLAGQMQEAVTDLAEAARKALHGAGKSVRWNPSSQTRFDAFGMDPELSQSLGPSLEALYRHYFRVKIDGLEQVPVKGRCLLVANHGGGLPWDAVMLSTAIRLEHAAPRPLRPLLEDFVCHAPFLGVLLTRLGGVRACQANALRLLTEEALVAVFPEGAQGLGKLYAQRHQLQRFGRGGFVKLALRSGTPILPVAIVGAEEAHPILCKSDTLARPLGLPFLPVTPTFPHLGPLGLLPLPSRWSIRIGSPIDLGGASAKDCTDRRLIAELTERVRGQIQGMVDELLEARGSAFF